MYRDVHILTNAHRRMFEGQMLPLEPEEGRRFFLHFLRCSVIYRERERIEYFSPDRVCLGEEARETG